MNQKIAVPIPVNVDQGQLAYELAAGIHDVNDIAARHSLDATQLTALVSTVSFRQLFQAAKAAYQSDDNLETRMQTKARLGLESSIAGITNMANGQAETGEVSPALRLQAGSLLHEITGLKKAKPAEVGAGDKFTLNITLAGEKKPITIEAQATHVEEGDFDAE